jgi:hypothetical protein
VQPQGFDTAVQLETAAKPEFVQWLTGGLGDGGGLSACYGADSQLRADYGGQQNRPLNIPSVETAYVQALKPQSQIVERTHHAHYYRLWQR